MIGIKITVLIACTGILEHDKFFLQYYEVI